MEGTNLDCEQFKCCKLPHIKVWSQTKYARSHVSPTLISVRDLSQPANKRAAILLDTDSYENWRKRLRDLQQNQQIKSSTLSPLANPGFSALSTVILSLRQYSAQRLKLHI